MPRQSRRTFLRQAAGVAAAFSMPTPARADVNSQIRMAVIGLNGRGKAHIDGFQNQLVALCDCDSTVLHRTVESFQKNYGRKLDSFVDYRKLLDRPDIDAVSIATPNHTHSLIAIAAAQAGKDVYVEKPVSQNVWEGRQLVNAADRYQCMIQSGTQSRSCKAIRQAVDFIHNGRLGKIKYIVGTCFKPRMSIGKSNKPLVIPQQLDYELWCGPAAKVELFRPERNSQGGYNPHYDWHWDYNTGCGDMGNQGIHQMDIARWFLGAPALSPRIVSFGGRFGYEDAGNTANTQVVLHDYPEAPIIFETRGLPSSKAAQIDPKIWANSMDDYHGSRVGVVVHCEHGLVVSTNQYDKVDVFDSTNNKIKTFHGGSEHEHFQNFLVAVRSRKRNDLHADILDGHISSALCHTGTISHQLGEPRTAQEALTSADKHQRLRESLERMFAHLRANTVEIDRPAVTLGAWLEMDPKTEQFTNNEAANKLLRREDRKPFVVSEIS